MVAVQNASVADSLYEKRPCLKLEFGRSHCADELVLPACYACPDVYADGAAGVRCVDHACAVDCDAYMVDRGGITIVVREKDQVAWLDLASGNVAPRLPLCGGVAADVDSGPGPGIFGEAGAVETAGSGAAADSEAGAVRSAAAPGVRYAAHA